MSVGIAFSGGGISAAIGSACAWNAIASTYPSIDSLNVTISTVSGGSMGYGLWVNANDKIHFPTYRRNVTLEELLEPHHASSGINGTNYSFGDNYRNCDPVNEKLSVGEFAKKIRALPFTKLFSRPKKRHNCRRKTHWWSAFINDVFDIVCVNDIISGSRQWVSSFAFVGNMGLLKRNHEQGTLVSTSAKMIHHALANLVNGNSFIVNDGEKRACSSSTSVLDQLSYGTAFWAAPLVTTNTFVYNILGNVLLKANQSTFCFEEESSGASAVMLDGGVVDTTGMIGLLQKQTEHIVAFYNNNVPLSKVQSPIAYLFGAPNITTDSMNSLLGPTISQVFPSDLYPAVIANLTSGGMVHLRDIKVLPNQMGVDPYAIKSLVIFSNANNDNFILDDHRILKALSANWPDNYIFSPPQLDSSTLCLLNDWKIRNNKEVLDSVLGTTSIFWTK